MNDVFDKPNERLSDAYLEGLLGRDDFWAVAAFVGEELAGGITAHVLPMTDGEYAELFIYDVAVRQQYRRMGIGRQLISAICQLAAQRGIRIAFVVAENLDTHALDFYRSLGGRSSATTVFEWATEIVPPSTVRGDVDVGSTENVDASGTVPARG